MDFGGKMYYHVRITQKSNKIFDEIELDLNEERLRSQFVIPYENNESIFIDGKTIHPDDIERIKISRTEDNSSKLIPNARARRGKSCGLPLPPDGWYVAKEGEDVTYNFIFGPPGYNKKMSKEDMTSKPQSNQIFIVHGHDNEMKETVARILEKLSLEPIILHEQADIGATIIEKFEKYAENVSFAVVLLSPDDKGYDKDHEPQSASYRARQNVILELGYFIGKLGREKVFSLLRQEENFDFPSDIFGRLWTPYDSAGYWKNKLAKELDAAGYNIDYSKL